MNAPLFLVSIALFIVSCTDRGKVITEDFVPDCSGMLDVKKWRNEILDVDSLKINGRIPVICDKLDIVNLLGKPDQEIDLNISEGFVPYLIKDSLSKASRVQYGRTIFDEVEGKVIVNTIDFRSTDIELNHPKVVLKYGMSAIEISKVFPESCKLIIVNGNAWSGHVELLASNKELDPRRWFLVFQNEGLIKVILYTFSRE